MQQRWIEHAYTAGCLTIAVLDELVEAENFEAPVRLSDREVLAVVRTLAAARRWWRLVLLRGLASVTAVITDPAPAADHGALIVEATLPTSTKLPAELLPGTGCGG